MEEHCYEYPGCLERKRRVVMSSSTTKWWLLVLFAPYTLQAACMWDVGGGSTSSFQCRCLGTYLQTPRIKWFGRLRPHPRIVNSEGVFSGIERGRARSGLAWLDWPGPHARLESAGKEGQFPLSQADRKFQGIHSLWVVRKIMRLEQPHGLQ